MKPGLIQQEDDYGCAVAALGMALGVSYKAAREEVRLYWECFHPVTPYKGLSWEEESIILYKHGIKTFPVWLPDDRTTGSFKKHLGKCRALMSVPSINVPGLFHALFWDGLKLYDPSKLKTYTAKRAWEVVRLVRVLDPLKSKHDLYGIIKGHTPDRQDT